MLKDFGKRLSLIRRKKAWGQTKLAAECGIAASQVSDYERGAALPSLLTLWKIKRALGCNWEELLG